MIIHLNGVLSNAVPMYSPTEVVDCSILEEHHEVLEHCPWMAILERIADVYVPVEEKVMKSTQ
jgi:hypothetical protein